MHNAHDPKVLPIRDGVSPSCVVLPSQGGGLLIDFLAERLPAGKYLQQTLLVRLKREFDLPELSPIHRIDRDTAGLVVFSVQRATRGIYQALFRDRAIHKTYEAVAPWREDVVFPRTHESRME